ncbi:MAG: hypothetical protein AAGE01_11730 [Pseudomonadota bacterium]
MKQLRKRLVAVWLLGSALVVLEVTGMHWMAREAAAGSGEAAGAPGVEARSGTPFDDVLLFPLG